ncbi:MAG TPA: ester cyclase [Saprospiraceae bacterium]|nr:ester cyclase [Saprospiraceae bacterium]
MNAHAFLSNLISAWTAHDRQRLLDLYHPDFEGEDLSEGKNASGLRDAGRMIDYVLTAFPDLEMELLEWGVDGDKVFCFWQATGHQRGRLMNIPPTGKYVSFMGSTFMTLKDGKIIRSRRIWDVATALRHIGLLPEPTTIEYK